MLVTGTKTSNLAHNLAPVSKSDNERGLSFDKVASIRREFGYNEIKAQNLFQPLRLFFNQFASPLVLILGLAAAVAMLAGLRKDGFLILFILVLNAVLGFWQEYKAEKSIMALKKMNVDRARVIRGGREFEIESRDLVPGDLLVLVEGQTVPADAYLLAGSSLEVNESALT